MAKKPIRALLIFLSTSLLCSSISFAAQDEREPRIKRQSSEPVKIVEPRNTRNNGSNRASTGKNPARVQSNSQRSLNDKKSNFSIPKNTTKHNQGANNSRQTERQRVIDARETIRSDGNVQRRSTQPEASTPSQPVQRRQYNHTQRDDSRREITLSELNRQRDRQADSGRQSQLSQSHNDRQRDGESHAQRHADYNQRDRQTRDRPRLVVNQHYHNLGHEIRRLPTGIRRLYYRPFPLYYFGGTYYRPHSGGFVVVRAPIGVRVRSLPIGFATLTFGTSVYYHVNDVYYRRSGTEYIVVDAPSDTYTVPVASTYSSGDWAIYPRYGQTDEQLQQDRYECHLWAFDRTGYDPSMPYQDNSLRSDYYRAQAACLEGRGYTVK